MCVWYVFYLSSWKFEIHAKINYYRFPHYRNKVYNVCLLTEPIRLQRIGPEPDEHLSKRLFHIVVIVTSHSWFTTLVCRQMRKSLHTTLLGKKHCDYRITIRRVAAV